MAKSNKLTRTQIEKLALFIKRAGRLPERDCYHFLASYKSSLRLEFKQGEPIKLSNLVKPEIETFRSYLIDFRPFVSQKEPVFVERILNICINRARHIAFREQLKQLQDEWHNAINMISKITRDTPSGSETLYTSNELFLMWLNGTVFHMDLEAEKFFEDRGGILNDTFEVRVAKYIGWCSNFIVQLAMTIESGLKNNDFDYVNEHTPHNRPKVTATVSSESKAHVIEFWNGTRQISQAFATCEEHDQDPIIVVEGYKEDMTDFTGVNVEIRACCTAAIDNALKRIAKSLAWIEYLKTNPNYKSGSVELHEFQITDELDIQCIKIALENYKQKWRRTVGNMRCPTHRMPPGARAFGEDIYHQGPDRNYAGSMVYLQGCCESFMAEVMQKLRTLSTE